MGKLTFGDEGTGARGKSLLLESGVEFGQLFFGHCEKEGLEEDDGFADTGVDVVVGEIEEVPGLIGLQRISIADVRSRGGEGGVEVLHEFEEGGNFVKELGTLAKQQAAAEAIEMRGAAAGAFLEIIGIEGTKIRSGAKVFRMG